MRVPRLPEYGRVRRIGSGIVIDVNLHKSLGVPFPLRVRGTATKEPIPHHPTTTLKKAKCRSADYWSGSRRPDSYATCSGHVRVFTKICMLGAGTLLRKFPSSRCGEGGRGGGRAEK